MLFLPVFVIATLIWRLVVLLIGVIMYKRNSSSLTSIRTSTASMAFKWLIRITIIMWHITLVWIFFLIILFRFLRLLLIKPLRFVSNLLRIFGIHRCTSTIRNSTSGTSHSYFSTTCSNSHVTFSCSKCLWLIIIIEFLTFCLILLTSFSVKSIVYVRFLVILLSLNTSETSSFWWLIKIFIMVVISLLLILISIVWLYFVILRRITVLFSPWLWLITTLIIILSWYFTLASSTIPATFSFIFKRLCWIISFLFFIILLTLWLIILRITAIWNALFPLIFNGRSFLSIVTTRSLSKRTTSSDWGLLIYSSIFIIIWWTFIRNILSPTRTFINMEIISASKWLISCGFSTYHTSTSATFYIACSKMLLIVLSLFIKVWITSSFNLLDFFVLNIAIYLIIDLSIYTITTIRSISTTSNTLFISSRRCSKTFFNFQIFLKLFFMTMISFILSYYVCVIIVTTHGTTSSTSTSTLMIVFKFRFSLIFWFFWFTSLF